MRQSTLLISTSLLAIGFGFVAHAATTPTPVSDFHVSSVVPADSVLKPYCAMANRFSNGLIITHSRNNFGLGSMSFDFPDVEFNKGNNYQITVKSGSLTRHYAAIAAKTNLLIAKTGRDDVLFNALDAGTPLSVQLENGAVSFDLVSNKEAFAEFDDCITGLEQAPIAPVAIAQEKQQQIEKKIAPIALDLIPTTPPVVQKETIPMLVLPTKKIITIKEEALPKVELNSLTEAPKPDTAKKTRTESVIPLSAPINPAQIGLEKSSQRHSIRSSNLLFDSPDIARLAVPSKITENTLIKPVIRTTARDFIVDKPAPLLKEIEKASVAPAPVVEEIITKVEIAEPIIEAVKAPTYTHESVLPTHSLVQTPEPKKTVSVPVFTPPPIFETPAVVAKEQPIKTVVPIIEETKAIEPTPTVIADPVIVKPIPQPRFTNTAPKAFVPPAAHSVQNWTVKNVRETSDFPSYCLISNRFENGMGLYATRSPDGNSTLGLDFGFDILEQDRRYAVTVEVDHLFNNDFTAQASDDVMMVIQMGKKDTFFNALRQGQALHISMPGAASTFDLANINASYNEFTQCLALQNGAAIAETVTPVVVATAPVVSKIITPQEPTKTVIKEDILPKNSLPIVKQKTVVAMTQDQTVTPTEAQLTAKPVELTNFSQKFTPKHSLANDNFSIDSILTASRIGHSSIRMDDQNSNIMHWTTETDNIAGILVETPWTSQTSLLDRLMDDVDTMEQTCMGEFTSQIGIPETYGHAIIANAETKCITGDIAVSAAHVYQGSGNTIKVWTQSGPSKLSQDIINHRNKISGILRQRATALSTK